MRNYPNLSSKTLNAVIDVLLQIIQQRQDDVKDIDNLPSVFMSGRKVNKIPANSADVTASVDRVGDFNYSTTFLYICVNNAGTAEWVRTALATF